jgi:NAD(P)-dependent dehydrogenase (short-subunit alcohol dehydrogenase family)
MEKEKAVLITGCSSGIGRATALHLAQAGFTVLATVRQDPDAEALRALNQPGLIPICPLDLAHPEHIPPAVEAVKRELAGRGIKGLYAFVNNAGGGFVAPVELMDVDRFRAELEVRLAGPLALVQALLPLIREAGGRLVWIVTPAIIPTPYVASIHTCDFAVNCLVRTLDIELKRMPLPVIMVRCGGIQTAAVGKTYVELEEQFRSWPPDRLALYEQALRRWQEEMAAFDSQRTPPEAVAEVVYRALSAPRPRRHYSVGHMARAAAFLEALPQGLVDAILKARA